MPTATSGAVELRFFDSSAVVQMYLQEEHSERMRGWLTPGDCVVSRLAEVEVSSAFSRGVRHGVLTAEHADRALAGFRADMRRWEVMELTHEVVSEAIRLLWSHPLRAADAIQLSAAIVFEREIGQPLQDFVAFDQSLAEAARAERLQVFPE